MAHIARKYTVFEADAGIWKRILVIETGLLLDEGAADYDEKAVAELMNHANSLMIAGSYSSARVKPVGSDA